MSERQRIAFIAACLFFVGLHLKTAGRVLLAGWLGPYRDAPVAQGPARAPELSPALASADESSFRVRERP
jgi:hypothetical protein